MAAERWQDGPAASLSDLQQSNYHPFRRWLENPHGSHADCAAAGFHLMCSGSVCAVKADRGNGYYGHDK